MTEHPLRDFVYDWVVNLWYVWAMLVGLAIVGVLTLYDALT